MEDLCGNVAPLALVVADILGLALLVRELYAAMKRGASFSLWVNAGALLKITGGIRISA